ncbi:Uma2 family endonuclease [Synechococcus bigranulatus str. 'Rupite']|uniref:Uma2 family endonuclease n=1 Tax=Thermostichus vulcanus str. 'Rupite' TaxID=2813851 RepID=A0ABT0CFM6_THEVL|nr:Uma2 family endonuclease [Thermostichus vulcanus]MCJ2544583.1 Uma2 family endonuclease [Thermostichus vulcanus str. 'Rupite']
MSVKRDPVVSTPPKPLQSSVPEEDTFLQPDPPDISDLVIEDDQPVDSLYSEKLQRLLVSCLYASFQPGIPFLATANVGLFYALKSPPLVPDVMVSLEVSPPASFERKEDRTYFVWEMGKPPDVAIEIVSNKKGQELGRKLRDYARAGLSYYVVYDPLHQLKELQGSSLALFRRQGGEFVPFDSTWLEDIGLGLTLWQGSFEGVNTEWLRWCDREGQVLLTGEERAALESQRAAAEQQRAEQLLQLLRAHGITPPGA